MPIRSMTGFARVSRSLPSGELTLTIKTVNHRGLDLHFHMPMDFDAIEPALRAAIRKRMVRGHAQVMVSFKRAASAGGDSTFAINEAMLQGWFSAFRAAAAHLGLQDQQPDLNEALRLPGMVEPRAASSEPDAGLEAETLAAAAEALEELESGLELLVRHLLGDLRSEPRAGERAAAEDVLAGPVEGMPVADGAPQPILHALAEDFAVLVVYPIGEFVRRVRTLVADRPDAGEQSH